MDQSEIDGRGRYRKDRKAVRDRIADDRASIEIRVCPSESGHLNRHACDETRRDGIRGHRQGGDVVGNRCRSRGERLTNRRVNSRNSNAGPEYHIVDIPALGAQGAADS